MKRLAAFVILTLLSWAAHSKPKYVVEGNFSGRFGEHLGYLRGVSSQRFDLKLQQSALMTPEFSAVVGMGGWNDSVYTERPDLYSAQVAQDDSSDLRLRNAYLGYKSGPWDFKAGWQHVVWGEAIGYSPLDFINPKDLRDGGFGDPSSVRLQVPMASARFIADAFSVQALYLPQPEFNILPSPGNDFAFPFASSAGLQNLRILRETRLAWEADNADYGAKFGALLGSWDLGFYYFDSFDRNPSYVFHAFSPVLTVREMHTRIKNYGFSLTNDFDGFLMRLELVITEHRRFTTVSGFSLASFERTNPQAVVGVDLPTWAGFNTSLQWSFDRVTDPPGGLLRTADQSILSFRISKSFFLDHEAEMIESYSLADAGSKLQMNYLIPLSRNSELSTGIEWLSGPETSDFGRRRNATRALATFKYFFKN